MGRKKAAKSQTRRKAPAGVPTNVPRGLGAVAGEIAGAVLGSAAGPAGAVAGMVLGGLVGEVTSEVLERESVRARRHDEELDATIGVYGGQIGAALPGSPPARIGAPSAASLGLGGGSGSTPCEGPIQDVDD